MKINIEVTKNSSTVKLNFKGDIYTDRWQLFDGGIKAVISEIQKDLFIPDSLKESLSGSINLDIINSLKDLK